MRAIRDEDKLPAIDIAKNSVYEKENGVKSVILRIINLLKFMENSNIARFSETLYAFIPYTLMQSLINTNAVADNFSRLEPSACAFKYFYYYKKISVKFVISYVCSSQLPPSLFRSAVLLCSALVLALAMERY